jgi:hypothetical protein
MTQIPIRNVAMMASAILSDTVGKHSEIDSLTRRVRDLSDKVDFWNRWMLWGLAAAVVVAAWVVLTTRLTIVRSKQLSIAQDSLEGAKERGSSEAIAAVNQRAEEAREQTARLTNENLKLAEQVAIQGSRYVQIVAARKHFVESLQPFSRQKFEIGICDLYFPSDSEIFSLYAVLDGTLTSAGWKSDRDSPVPTGDCGTGVIVTVFSTAPASSKEAARKLADLLDTTLGKFWNGKNPQAQAGLFVAQPPPAGKVTSPSPSSPEIIRIDVGKHP